MSKLTNLAPLSQELAALIHSAKQRAAVAVNSEITLLYWQVGYRINQAVLGGERADYGKRVIATLSNELTVQFGKGWSKRNLAQMVKFAEVFLGYRDCARTAYTIELDPYSPVNCY